MPWRVGGTPSSRLKTQSKDPAGKERSLEPFSANLGCLCLSSQAAPMTLGKNILPLPLSPALWGFSVEFYAIYWGDRLREKLCGHGTHWHEPVFRAMA